MASSSNHLSIFFLPFLLLLQISVQATCIPIFLWVTIFNRQKSSLEQELQLFVTIGELEDYQIFVFLQQMWLHKTIQPDGGKAGWKLLLLEVIFMATENWKNNWHQLLFLPPVKQFWWSDHKRSVVKFGEFTLHDSLANRFCEIADKCPKSEANIF